MRPTKTGLHLTAEPTFFALSATAVSGAPVRLSVAGESCRVFHSAVRESSFRFNPGGVLLLGTVCSRKGVFPALRLLMLFFLFMSRRCSQVGSEDVACLERRHTLRQHWRGYKCPHVWMLSRSDDNLDRSFCAWQGSKVDPSFTREVSHA